MKEKTKEENSNGASELSHWSDFCVIKLKNGGGRRGQEREWKKNHFFSRWKHVTTLIKRMNVIEQDREKETKSERESQETEKDRVSERARDGGVKQDWKSLQ